MTKENRTIFEFADVRVEPLEQKIWLAGDELALEPKTFQVLLFLIENRGRLIEKSELLDAVWHDAFVTENAMTREIAKLRKALGDGVRDAKIIQTVHTRGYRFIAEVREIHSETPSNEIEPRETEAAKIPSEKPHETSPPFVNSKPKRQILTITLFVIGIAAVCVAAFFGLQRLQTPNSAATPEFSIKTQITASTALDTFPAFAPDGGAVAYSSNKNGNFEIYVKPLVTGGREIQITTDGAQNFHSAWSPDGKMLAFHSQKRGGIWLIPALGGTARRLTDFGSSPKWSPDGKNLVFASDGLTDVGLTSFSSMPPSTLWTILAAGGEPQQITKVGEPTGGHGSPSFSPDGKRILFISNDTSLHNIWTMAADGGDLKSLTPNERFGFRFDPVFTPDGKSVYFTAEKNFRTQISAVGVSETGEPAGEPQTVFDTGDKLFRHLSFSADGKRLLYSALKLSSNIWSADLDAEGKLAGAPKVLIEDTNYRKTFPMFSPDGRSIAYTVWRNGAVAELWLMNADGGNQRQVMTDYFFGTEVNWFGRDGGRIMFPFQNKERVELRAVALEDGKKSNVGLVPLGSTFARASPDGTSIVYNFRQSGTLNLWKNTLPNGEPQQLTFDKELMGFPCWSPDGKWIGLEVKRGESTFIAVMPSEGGEVIQLNSDKGQSWGNSFAPDNDRILFAGRRESVWNIFTISRTTKEQKQLTNYNKLNSYTRYPSWSPLNNQIVYEYAETTGNVWIADLK